MRARPLAAFRPLPPPPALPGAQGAQGQAGQNNVTHIHSAQQGGNRDETVYHSGTVLDPLPDGSDEMVAVASVQGGVQRGWINTVGELIEREPEDAIKVVKSWLAEGSAT